MKFSYLCLLGLSAMMFWSCASRYSSPVLIERGEGRKEYEREYFAIKESMGIDKRLKDVFKQGYIEEDLEAPRRSPSEGLRRGMDPREDRGRPLRWLPGPHIQALFQLLICAEMPATEPDVSCPPPSGHLFFVPKSISDYRLRLFFSTFTPVKFKPSKEYLCVSISSLVTGK